MEPFFQHLVASPAASRADGKQMLMLEDLERNTTGQSMPRVVTDAGTKRHYLVRHTLPAGIPDFAPFERDYPTGQTSTLTDSQITARTSRALNRLDAENDGFGPVTIQERTAGPKRLTLFETSGLPVGYDTANPFTVAHAGGSRWHVSDGKFRYAELAIVNEELVAPVKDEFSVGGGIFTLTKGWIGFYVSVSPVYDEDTTQYGYGAVKCSSMQAHSTFSESRPSVTLPVPASEDTPPEDVAHGACGPRALSLCHWHLSRHPKAVGL